jgi:hypothetical protein
VNESAPALFDDETRANELELNRDQKDKSAPNKL